MQRNQVRSEGGNTVMIQGHPSLLWQKKIRSRFPCHWMGTSCKLEWRDTSEPMQRVVQGADDG